MRYLIMLEQTEAGFAVQVPDLAIITFGKDVEEAKRAAIAAIRVNLEAYRTANKPIPKRQSPFTHLRNPDYADVVFTYVDVGVAQKPQKNAVLLAA